MSPPRDPRVAVLKERIDKLAADCISWRAAGLDERYLEAFTRLESLEAELASLEGQVAPEHRLERTRGPVAAPATLAARPTGEAGEHARLMVQHAVTFDGRGYHFAGYRYDRLSDAVNYSKLQGPGQGRAAANDASATSMVHFPSNDDRREMALNHVTFAGGVYWLGEYRYDRLEDALAQARFQGKTDPN